MCGIVGVASRVSQSNRAWLAIGRDAMAHRGPDDVGEWWSPDGRVGLAQRRLAILDLSSDGHQPMHDHFGELHITFNGEIYNFKELRDDLGSKGYVFKTRSDTEVILAGYREWGVECLNHFNGMFAFALYDSSAQKIFLARDRAGEKPLFYYAADETLYFSSELKAILANSLLPRVINLDAMDCYLGMGYVPGSQCILNGFKKLPPAHALLMDLRNGALQRWRYWCAPDLELTDEPIDEVALLDELEALLQGAVQRQLLTADVSVGVLLSGGVDSSLITAMAARSVNRVKTFTVGFPGYGALDETRHAQLVSKYFGTDHTELIAQDFSVDLMPLLARQFDEPIVDSSMIPTFMVSQLIRRHCSVALGGDGGDELFGGYAHHNRLQWLQRFGFIPRPFRSAVAKAAENYLPMGMWGRNWLQRLDFNFQNSLPFSTNFFDVETRRKLMVSFSNWPFSAESIYFKSIPNAQDLLQRTTRMDYANYLPEDILVKVDRSSMLNSLELRSPFLDLHMVDFAFRRVPSHLKATTGEKKILLKRLTSRLLPQNFDRKRKQGFSIPLNSWLKNGPYRSLFKEVLQDSNCIFERGVVNSLLRGQDFGFNNGERLFSLVFFELWRREYNVTF